MSIEPRLISVVIPLYNKREDIRRAVDSVLAQSWANLELLVVDDGSTDGSLEELAGYDDARMRIVRQRNAGVSAARNTGAREARAEWVAYLDADDYWAPQHLDNLVRAADLVPDAPMCATAYFVVSEDGSARKIVLPPELDGQLGVVADYFDQVLRFEHPVHSSAVMVRKSALLAMGGFPMGMTQGEDIVVWATLACQGRLAYCGDASAYYVAPPTSVERRQGALRQPQRPDRVAAALEALRGSCPNVATLQAFLGEWHRIRAMLFLERNERVACLKELAQAGHAGRWRLRDLVSVALLMLPQNVRRQVLASLRTLRRGRTAERGA
jgi:cellulose synthase/poly-beta-1,6-N-acetylglucosamine synthase-like glycosyltransferase